MANIILINDQDQEQTLTGVEKITVRSPGSAENFVQGSAVIAAQKVTARILDRSISGEYANTEATEIGHSAFRLCKSLSGISLPNVIKVGQDAFAGCVALRSVTLPRTTTIGIAAFVGCSALVDILLPKATTIGQSAFWNCSALQQVDLPDVLSIADSAFSNCSALSTVVLSSPQLCSLGGTEAFFGTPVEKSQTSGYIYVPDYSVELYKSTKNWSAYADKIKPISELNV